MYLFVDNFWGILFPFQIYVHHLCLFLFDDMIDRAPDGEIEIAGGVFKHAFDGNWKLYLENLCDAAHPLFVHQSSIEAAVEQDDEVHTDGAGEVALPLTGDAAVVQDVRALGVEGEVGRLVLDRGLYRPVERRDRGDEHHQGRYKYI